MILFLRKVSKTVSVKVNEKERLYGIKLKLKKIYVTLLLYIELDLLILLTFWRIF